MRRKFLRIIGLSLISTLLPIKILYAATKKLLNKNLTDEQKDIMFNEGTERPFSSELNKENREGFYHCANCGAKLFLPHLNLIAERDGLFQRHYLS